MEQYYTDATGRKMKKVLTLEDATWDVMGKRVLSGKEEFDGKQTSRERTVRILMRVWTKFHQGPNLI